MFVSQEVLTEIRRNEIHRITCVSLQTRKHFPVTNVIETVNWCLILTLL